MKSEGSTNDYEQKYGGHRFRRRRSCRRTMGAVGNIVDGISAIMH